MSSLETLLSEVDPHIITTEPSYITYASSALDEIGVTGAMEKAESEGRNLVRHGLGVARVALAIARKASFDDRNTVDACIGGLIHDSGKSLNGSPHSQHDSIDLESRLRERGMLSLGQSVRHNPYLVTSDVRHSRLSHAQYAVVLADAGTNRAGQYVGIPTRQAQVVEEKNIDPSFQARFITHLPDYEPPANYSPLPLGVTFIERFDGRYPISRNPDTQGKLSSMHVARCLSKIGATATIMAYVEGGDSFTVDGVFVDGDNTTEHLDEKVEEDGIVFVTGWTSAFERLREKGIPASLVMRSILETSLNPTRLERIRKAGSACILISPESVEQIGVNAEATIIPNGYDEKLFYYKPQPVGKQIFFAGALVPEKGVDHLIKIAKLMPDYKFVVAGSSEMYGISDHSWDMPTNVTRIGEVSQEVLAEFFRGSLASLMLTDPSRIFEVAGKSGIESTLCGCPLVYIRNGGLKSNIVNHELTSSVNSPDVDKLVATIRKIEESGSNQELRKDLASKAKAHHLTWEQVAARFLARGLDSIVEAEAHKNIPKGLK